MAAHRFKINEIGAVSFCPVTARAFSIGVNMNKRLRIILVFYCLSVAYCCIWVPWHLVHGDDQIRAGYGLIWTGPSTSIVEPPLTIPDFPIIALRIAALTFIGGAIFFGTTRN